MPLPDASGESVLALLRGDERLRSVPVVVVSADATQARVDEMLDSGVQAYLTKPLVLADTPAVIDRLLAPDAAG